MELLWCILINQEAHEDGSNLRAGTAALRGKVELLMIQSAADQLRLNGPLHRRSCIIGNRTSIGEKVQRCAVAGNALGRDGGMILPMDTEQGRRCWDDLTRGLDACAQMKLPIYLAPAFFAGFPRTQAERRRIAQRMKEACHYCLGSQVTVTLESIFSATELRRLIDWIDSPNFGIYYDTQNPVTYAGIHVPDDIRAIGPGKIAQIHVKDGVGSIQGSVNLGMGETDFFATAEAIREIGYDGWIVLENYYSRPCFSSELADPWDRIARDAEIARKAFHIT